MRVVHLYDGHERVHGGRGSVPGVVWNVARETAAVGHDVAVLERQWDGLSSRAVHDGVRFLRFDTPTGSGEPWERVPHEAVKSVEGAAGLLADRLAFAARALASLRRLDFDVLHAHLPFAAAALAAVAPPLRERLVYTAHLGELRLDALRGDDVDVPAVLRVASPDAFLARRAARTTVLNRSIRDRFAALGVPPERLAVVPNGVALDRFRNVDAADRERVRCAYALGEGPTVLFVGTLLPRKGVAELVEAFAEVDAPGGDRATLVLAGDDEVDPAYAERVREVARERDVDDRVRVPGFVSADDLPALYDAADAVVLPSFEEGFGMTLLEAMAAGTPVVSTRVGAAPRLLADGGGLLVDEGDVDALAAALDRLIGDPGVRDRLADRARDAAADYAWDRVAADFVGVYREVARA